MAILSSGEIKFIKEGISQGLRNDGRGRDEFRLFDINTGVITQANGSARVQLGGTQLLSSVKAELGSPLEGKPGHGRVEVAVECSPTAAPEYKGQGGDDLASDLARALERCFLGGSAIDMSALSIVEGKMCWILYMDVLILSMDGSLLDAIGMGFKAALSDLRLPKVSFAAGEEMEDDGDFEIVDDIEECTRLDITGVPLIITLTKVGKDCIVDADSYEECLSAMSLSVAVTSTGKISGTIKNESSLIESSLLLDMLSMASRLGKQLHKRVDASIALARQLQP